MALKILTPILDKFSLASGELQHPQSHLISVIIVEKPHLYLLSIKVLGKPFPKASQLLLTVKMALKTRFKRQSIAQSLMSSDDVTTTSGLNGIVPPNTQTSLDRMSYFLQF